MVERGWPSEYRRMGVWYGIRTQLQKANVDSGSYGIAGLCVSKERVHFEALEVRALSAYQEILAFKS
jgi:hypothetical protein